MTLERGALVNKRYRIVEILGQGGMAAVYRAIDENLGVEVAVKENLFTTEEYARQFRREAVILANLRHPNLPRVTDHFVVEHQGQYLVMDYIEGEDLRQRMERVSTLSEQEATIVGVALCDALIYMHSRKPQVLHRDIKPGNVKITPHGQIFLVDFGLAKVVQGRQATTTGARAMTPGYSPPEQYGTARTDHRSDIYSLGATLYSAMTDVIPEDGLARAMEQSTLTPLTRRNPKVSKKIAQAIEKAMAVRPDERYQSVEEFRIDLLNARATTRRKTPLELTLDPPPLGSESPRLLSELEEDQPKGGNNRKSDPLLSLPGSTSLEDDAFDDFPRPKRRKKSQGALWLLWLLLIIFGGLGAFVMLDPVDTNRALAQVNLTLPSQVLAWARFYPTPTTTWIPTQTIIPSATPKPPTPTEMRALDTPTLTQSATITPTPTPSATPTLSPTPTPLGGGGGLIAFARYMPSVSKPNIWVMNSDGTEQRQLTDITEGACQPDWHPDGTKLVFISPCPRNFGAYFYAEEKVYMSSSLFTINLDDVDGSSLTPVSSLAGGGFDPAWSPDGKLIAFTSLRDVQFPQIHVINLETGVISLLADNPKQENMYPGWSPDGRYLVFSKANNLIQLMSNNGGERFLAARNVSEYKNIEPTWSPDGETILFELWDGDLAMLMAVQFSLEGNLPVKIQSSEYLTEPDYSPDGFWIAASGIPDGQPYRSIYIMLSNGVNRQRLTSEYYDFDPSWQP